MFDQAEFFDPPKGMFYSGTPTPIDLCDLRREKGVLPTNLGTAVIRFNLPLGQNAYKIRVGHDGTILMYDHQGTPVTISYEYVPDRDQQRNTKTKKNRPGQNYLNLRKERW